MRPGHKSSCGLEAGLETDAKVEAVLVAVPEQELVDEDRAEGEAPGGGETPGRDCAVGVEAGFELLVEVLDRGGTQLMEDAPPLDAVVGVRVAALPGGDEDLTGCAAGGAYVRGIVLVIPEDEAPLGGQHRQQQGGDLVVGGVGRRQL